MKIEINNKILSEYELLLIKLQHDGKITYMSEADSQKIINEIYKDFPINNIFIDNELSNFNS